MSRFIRTILLGAIALVAVVWIGAFLWVAFNPGRLPAPSTLSLEVTQLTQTTTVRSQHSTLRFSYPNSWGNVEAWSLPNAECKYTVEYRFSNSPVKLVESCFFEGLIGNEPGQVVATAQGSQFKLSLLPTNSQPAWLAAAVYKQPGHAIYMTSFVETEQQAQSDLAAMRQMLQTIYW